MRKSIKKSIKKLGFKNAKEVDDNGDYTGRVCEDVYFSKKNRYIKVRPDSIFSTDKNILEIGIGGIGQSVRFIGIIKTKKELKFILKRIVK